MMAKRSRKSKGASMRPGDMSEGGGLPEGEQTVVRAYFDMFDYGGTRDEVPALVFDLEDPSGGQNTQFWSAGKASDWEPSEDGTGLESVNERMEDKSINLRSNAGMLLSSLVDHGFDEDELEKGDVSVVKGLVAEFAATKIERKGISDSNCLLITDILQLPGESDKEAKKRRGKGGSGRAGKSAGKAGKAKKKEPEEDVEDLTERVIADILDEEGQVPIRKIVTHVHKAIEDDDKFDNTRDEILELAGDTDFLEDDKRPWEVKKRKLVAV